jgi:hypothetical protein
MPGLVRPALRAILDATDGIQAAVRGKSLDDFSADWLLRHGVQRGIEIVSEAARRSRTFRGRRSWASATCSGTSITGFPTRWCGTWCRIICRH